MHHKFCFIDSPELVRYGHRDELEVCCCDSEYPSNRMSQPYGSQIDLQEPRVKLLTYLMRCKGFSPTAVLRGRFPSNWPTPSLGRR